MTYHPELDKVLLFKTIDSTNVEAQRRRDEFQGRNILIISDEQTTGKGQHGNHWESQAGLGLWMSLVLGKQAHLNHNLQLLSLYTGIVIQHTIVKLINAKVELKWPNDIIIGSRKCGGVLTEIQWMGKSASSATIGIGINLKHSYNDFSSVIRNSATSLLIEGWQKPERDQFLHYFLNLFFDKLSLLDQAESLIADWNKHAFKLNKTVRWQSSSENFEGQFLGINQTGEAQILIGDVVQSFSSGEIHLITDS